MSTANGGDDDGGGMDRRQQWASESVRLMNHSDHDDEEDDEDLEPDDDRSQRQWLRGSFRRRVGGPTLNDSKISKLLSLWLPWYGKHATLEDAWHYFEYYILPRRMARADGKGYSRAPVGMMGSELYPVFSFSSSHFSDFGIGIAVYFETLRALIVCCLIAGILSVPNIWYYARGSYSVERVNHLAGSGLEGSMICPTTQWVPCPDCPIEDFQEHEDVSRIAYDTTSGLTFGLKNSCADLRWFQGVDHLVVMSFLALSIFFLGRYQRIREQEFDESILTASDFSIQVDNPPEDAKDPDEWKEFFEQFGKVAFVTVALDNTTLLKALVKRRAYLQKARLRAKDEERVKYTRKLRKYNEKCANMVMDEYPTSAVFVTFEKEKAQRLALTKLQIGQINVEYNNTDVLEPNYVFRGNKVLDIFESPEPCSIRWQDLDESIPLKIFQKIVTTLVTILVIVLATQLVEIAYRRNVNVAAIVITLLNSILPTLLRLINALESHQSEDTYQASLYWKNAIFRWVNTGVITIMITPITKTLADAKDSLVAAVQAVLQAEILLTPTIELLDIGGHFQRFVLAPLAVNQSAMNASFRGTPVFMGEKYSNVTKTVFLVFFYAGIFPMGFFYGSVALTLTYFANKFLLLRAWAPVPRLGNSVASLGRRIFFPFTVVILAVMSEFFYSAYPVDCLCQSDGVVGDNSPYIGNFTLVTTKGEKNITVDVGDDMFHYCNQDYLSHLRGLLNFFQKETDDWMTEEQYNMVYTFGFFALGTIAVMVGLNLHEDIAMAQVEALGGFSTTERDSGESYSDQEHIDAYIPQIPHSAFMFNLVAADINEFEGRFVGWKDPVHNYDFYNLNKDVKELGGDGASVLSRVRQYCERKLEQPEQAVGS